jgi:hypothetical protein
MLNIQQVVRGIDCLPWESIFGEYKVGNPVSYGLGISASYSGYSPTLPDTTRYFLLTANGHEEVDMGLQTSGQHYRLDVTPGYSTGYASTSPNYRLVFFIPLNSG